MTKFNILSITTGIAIALSSVTAFAGPITNTQADVAEDAIAGQNPDSAQNEAINQAVKNGTVIQTEENYNVNNNNIPVSEQKIEAANQAAENKAETTIEANPAQVHDAIQSDAVTSYHIDTYKNEEMK